MAPRRSRQQNRRQHVWQVALFHTKQP